VPSFALEARHAPGILGEYLRQHFDSDVATVCRAVDRAHTPFSEFRDDAVVADRRLGLHCWDVWNGNTFEPKCQSSLGRTTLRLNRKLGGRQLAGKRPNRTLVSVL
jgi:hypothetical protein